MSISVDDIAYQLANYDDDRSQEIVVVTMVMAGLATLAVLLRLWARKLIAAKLKTDDYLIIVGLLFTISNCVQIFPGEPTLAEILPQRV
jgi:nitrate reductase gamma subunit